MRLTKSFLLLLLLMITLPAAARASSGVVEVNMNALYEAVGEDVMEAAPARQAEAPGGTPISIAPPAEPVRTLQLLYGRGDLVITPSARTTLENWVETFVSPRDRIEILAYSGHRPESWSEPSLHPGREIATFSLHEAIRTCFKRALVVRDALIEIGVDADRILLRALGPADSGGPRERVDVSLIAPAS